MIVDVHGYNTRQCVSLYAVFMQTDLGLSCFSQMGPVTWNGIVKYIKQDTFEASFSMFMMTSSNGKKSALLALWAGIHCSPVNPPYKGQWLGALMLSLICTWINGWVTKREAGDLTRHHAH